MKSNRIPLKKLVLHDSVDNKDAFADFYSRINELRCRTFSLADFDVDYNVPFVTGGAATLFKAVSKSTGDVCVLKKLMADNVDRQDMVVREIQFHASQASSVWVVKFHGIIIDEDCDAVYLVVDLMSGGCLDGRKLSLCNSMSFKRMVKSIVLGLANLGNDNYIHCDLKPHDVLADNADASEQCSWKLADFGCVLQGDC
eukprot:TRINITY_DN8120_c0_g2_i2.p1 TRINITY_DN8120_c0_g2~~TRINITY_DN8120_c0_g2_i2.p1  ORF type:complete len:199 (-),score=43.72 TRINITY_DN8120_c0_g2_i2:115-711(-)